MFPRALVVLLVLSFVGASQATEERKPGLASRTWKTVQFWKKRPAKYTRPLEVSMTISPDPVNLSETRQIKVALSLTNRSKKYVHLEFPTTQRIEVLVREAGGKIVQQWSEDQAFANEATHLTVNPFERFEYHATVATRDLKAGRQYTIEAFFPNYDALRAEKVITPQ